MPCVAGFWPLTTVLGFGSVSFDCFCVVYYLSEFGSGLLDEISSEDDGSSPVERVMFERSLLLGVCVELWRMRSRLRLILSQIRRTWEVGGRGEDGVEFMSSGVAR